MHKIAASLTAGFGSLSKCKTCQPRLGRNQYFIPNIFKCTNDMYCLFVKVYTGGRIAR